jgi:hypothetical protein
VASLPQPDASFARAQENLKTAYNPERLPTYSRALFHALNARPFILFLEEMTGISGLIPDPYYMGAGIHRVANGGHLDIHADFNLHKPMMLERRLNVLIYLNPDWQQEWGDPSRSGTSRWLGRRRVLPRFSTAWSVSRRHLTRSTVTPKS